MKNCARARQTKLSDLNIDPASLIQTGKLTTKRAEFPIEEGLLAIDESWGDNLHDFELELEVGDASMHPLPLVLVQNHEDCLPSFHR